MPEPIISFVGTVELKVLLERWAAEDDRSVSYVLRQILKREAQRRGQTQTKVQETEKEITHDR